MYIYIYHISIYEIYLFRNCLILAPVTYFSCFGLFLYLRRWRNPMRAFVAIFRAMNGTAFEPPFPSGLQRTGAVRHKKWGKNWALARSMLLFGHVLLDFPLVLFVSTFWQMMRLYIYIIWVWPNHFESLHVEPQVLRKQSYKGNQSTSLSSLPLDCATSLGVLQVLASVLPCNALQAQTIEQCQKILEFMDYFAKINLTLFPLGKRVECELEVINNQVVVKQLQSVLKRMGVPWSRPGWI